MWVRFEEESLDGLQRCLSESVIAVIAKAYKYGEKLDGIKVRIKWCEISFHIKMLPDISLTLEAIKWLITWRDI